MDELVKSLSNNIKDLGPEIENLLQDKKNQEVAAIAGAVYLLSKSNKERNAIIAGVAAIALLPDKTKITEKN